MRKGHLYLRLQLPPSGQNRRNQNAVTLDVTSSNPECTIHSAVLTSKIPECARNARSMRADVVEDFVRDASINQTLLKNSLKLSDVSIANLDSAARLEPGAKSVSKMAMGCA